MKAADLLKLQVHRPWPVPTSKWLYSQYWKDLVFLHWKVDSEELRKWIPQTLTLDHFDGNTWISMVAFTMKNVRPRWLFPFPPISDFHEINIRTYVNYKGRSGVYFLSIEASKRLSAYYSAKLSGLPYRYSKIRRKAGSYAAKNTHFEDELDLKYSVGNPIKSPEPIDLWLTERYALFQDRGQSILEYEIQHIPWPLHQLDLHQSNLYYPRFGKLWQGAPQRMHYSKGLLVLAWNKRIINP